MLAGIVAYFTEVNSEGKRVGNGYMGSRNVFVMYKIDDDYVIAKVFTKFLVKSGTRSELYLDVEFTEDDVNIESITGKKTVTTSDIMAVAEKYKEIVRLYDSLKLS